MDEKRVWIKIYSDTYQIWIPPNDVPASEIQKLIPTDWIPEIQVRVKAIEARANNETQDDS